MEESRDRRPGALARYLGQGRVGWFSISNNTLRRRYALANSRWLDVGGGMVHYTDEGPADAPTLVLIHGFAASLHTWQGITAMLALRYRVIRVDIPPFGLTGPLRDERGKPVTMDLDRYRDFVDRLVAALRIRRATFIGNSLGGFLAWDLAVRRPDLIDKLVLIDAAGFPMKLPIYIDLFRHALVRWTSPWLLPEFVIRAATRDVYGDRASVPEATYRRYVDFFYGKGVREAIGRMVPKLDFDAAPTHLLQAIEAPTLVLWGGQDRWIPPSHAQLFTSAIPGARLCRYEQLGHIPMEEDPRSVLADLLPFLQGRHGELDGPEGECGETSESKEEESSDHP